MTQWSRWAVQDDKNFPTGLQACQQRDVLESLNLTYCVGKEEGGQKSGSS